MIDCILNRRAVRDFTSEKVTDEEMNLLLKAGMYAPSAMNTQPWQFIVLRDDQLKDEAAAICEYWKPLARAPLGICILGDLSIPHALEPFVVQDCSAAAENILCAAHGLGLDGVWLGLYGAPDRVSKIRTLFHLPDSILPVSILAIGHAARPRDPHNEFYADKVHYDGY